jgi:hypothetical protein
MIDDTMIPPPSNVRHQALATACSITKSHGYATDHAVLICDVDLATAGLEVPTQPSSKDTRPPSRRLKTPVEQASQHRVGSRALEECSGEIAAAKARLDAGVNSVKKYMELVKNEDASSTQGLRELEGSVDRF